MTRSGVSYGAGAALGAVLIALALARGGVPVVCGALLVLAVAAASCAFLLHRVRLGGSPDAIEAAWLGLWAVVTALCALQVLPLGEWVAGSFGAIPSDPALHRELSIRRISPQPGATATLWAQLSAYLAISFAASRLEERGVRALFATIGLLVCFECAYGLWAWWSEAPTILGLWPREHYLGDATGSYVSRNHYAGLLAAGWPVVLAGLLDSRSRDARATRACVAAGALVSLLVGAALWASHSRAGLSAACVGLAAWLGTRARAGARPNATSDLGVRSRPAVAWLSVTAAVCGAVLLAGAHDLGRFALLTEQTDRLVIWRALLDVPERTWILGAGVGSFPDVFKTVQPAGLEPSFLAAHNDWLELVFDFGIAGAALLGLAVLALWRCSVNLPRSVLRAGAFGGACVTALHASVDFVLHIPANAVLFALLTGVCLGRDTTPSAAARIRREKR